MKHTFSKVLKQRLIAAGWQKDRQLYDKKIGEWMSHAKQELGCHFFPEALRLLSTYGGLIIGGKDSPGSLYVDPTRYHQPYDKATWFEWEWELNQVLFPIGSLQNFDLTFAVGSNGTIYSYGVGDHCYGSSFEAALENLFGDPSDVTREPVIELTDVINARSKPTDKRIKHLIKQQL